MPKKPFNPPIAISKPERRKPSQARAEQTVRAIFEATAHVLNEQGEAALTTNRIAERAGVSIGTLYQYFDSKEAIVLAMLASERDRVMRKLDSLLATVDPADPANADPRSVLRAFIKQYVSSFGTGGPGRRALVRLAWRLDHHQAMVQSMREASERIALHLHRMSHPSIRPPTPTMTFVLTHLLAGTVRSAALEESPLLGTAAFEDDLVNACWGVMALERPSPPKRLRSSRSGKKKT